MWFRLYFVYYHVVAFVMYNIYEIYVCILSVYLYFEANETIKHIILTVKIHNYTLYWS